MAATTSMAEELLAAIKLPNLKQIVAYLSENDAMTVDQYVQSEYAREYAIDITNIHWGGEMHQGHVYDVYAAYSKKDSVQVRLDMLKFVTDNHERYEWTAHLYLQMNNMSLNTWTQKMTYWGNGADALAIYALSDMLGIHSTVVTKTKPWTSIESGITSNIFELLDLSAVKMVYLGNDRYAMLRKKSEKGGPCYIGPNYNYSPMLMAPSLPSRKDLDTANTLLELSVSKPKPRPKPRAKPKQKGKTTPAPIVEKPATQSAPVLTDAMDKIVGFEDDTVPYKNHLPDAMDALIECVQSDPNTTPSVLHVETPVVVHPPMLQSCCVKLKRLEHILADELVSVPPTSASDLGEGKHFTRSRSRIAKPRTGRRSRKASTGVQYSEGDMSEEKQCRSKPKPKPARSGPSDDRIDGRSRSTVRPKVTLPPIPGPIKPDEEDTIEQDEEIPSDTTELYDEDDIPLSVVKKDIQCQIKIKHHVLERKPAERKYKCRMCRDSLPSCDALNKHHRKKHGIVYCTVCRRPFNNPRSLTKHMYTHGEKKHTCNTCGQSFPFASQLTTHRLTHRRKPNQRCMYPKCGRKFKSKSDLNRHAATHTSKWMVCPDCDDYRTKDKRNFDSHRQSHNQIERYFCSKCNKGFVYSTQRIRHQKKCDN